MVTYFNKKDLINFGKYLLSDERTERITNYKGTFENVPVEERLKHVSHADVENFLTENRQID